MAKTEKAGSGIFDGTEIQGLDDNFGLIVPGSGEPDDKKDSEKEKKVDKEIRSPRGFNTGLLDTSTKIQIPETEAEVKAFAEGKTGKIEEENKGKAGTENEEEEGKENQGEGEDAVITEDSPLFLHAATLKEDGILPTLDPEDLKGKKYSEALKVYFDKMKEYAESTKNEYVNSLTPRQKEFLDMIEKGIPQEQAEHQITIEDAYSKITDEALSNDTELQEQLIVQNFKLKGLSDKQITTFLETSKDKETLFEDAKSAKDEVNAYIANQKDKMLKEAEREQREADEREKTLQKNIKSTVDGLTEILPGIKISAKEKTDLYDYMTRPVEIRNVNGNKVPVSIINKKREEDPISFNLRLIYYIQQGLFDKEVKDTKFEKKLNSNAASKLATKLKGGDNIPGQGIATPSKKDEKKPEKIIFPNL